MSCACRVLRSQRKIIGDLVVVNPDAAGIDAGSEEHWVSVPEDRSADDLPEEVGQVSVDAGRARDGRHDETQAVLHHLDLVNRFAIQKP